MRQNLPQLDNVEPLLRHKHEIRAKTSPNLTIGVIPIRFCIWSMSSDYKAMIEVANNNFGFARVFQPVIASNRFTCDFVIHFVG